MAKPKKTGSSQDDAPKPKRPVMTITLKPATIERLDAIAKGFQDATDMLPEGFPKILMDPFPKTRAAAASWLIEYGMLKTFEILMALMAEAYEASWRVNFRDEPERPSPIARMSQSEQQSHERGIALIKEDPSLSVVLDVLRTVK